MPQPDYTIRQNDHGEAITATLENSAGAAVNLTSATVTFTLRPIAGGDAVLDAAAASVITPAAGAVSYTWQALNTATPGWYLASWTATFSGGQVQTFPNGGYTLVQITAADETSSTDYLTVDALKATREIKTNYPVNDITTAIASASRAIDNRCNRRFYPDTDDTIMYYTARRTDWMSIEDLATLTTVEVDFNADGVFEQLWVEDTEFLLEPLNTSAPWRPKTAIRTHPFGGRWFPVPWPRTVKVTGIHGWLEPPDEVVQATTIIATQLLMRARDAPWGIVSIGQEAARLSRYDNQVNDLLDPLTRIAV